MKSVRRAWLLALAVAALCLVPLGTAFAAVDQLTPGMPHYFEHFDPTQKPWEPGQGLNIEEVFKNYQYYEIVLDQGGKEITVNHFIRNNKAGSEKYLLLPDRSLRKK